MIETPRIAIVGVGSIGSRHIDTLLAMGYQDLVGVDSRPMPHENRLPVVDALEDLDLWKPTHALICSPPAFHYHHAKHFLERGIPTFIEKPMTVSRFESAALLCIAKEYGTYIGIGYMERAHPMVQAARDFKKGPRLTHGYVECYWNTAIKTYELEVAQESSHAIDTAQFVFGPIESCDVRYKDKYHVDLAIRCQGGVDVTVIMDMLSAPLREVSVYTEDDLYIAKYGQDQKEWDDCYKAELQAFLNGKPLCTGDEGLRVVEVLEELR